MHNPLNRGISHGHATRIGYPGRRIINEMPLEAAKSDGIAGNYDQQLDWVGVQQLTVKACSLGHHRSFYSRSSFGPCY